LGHPNSVVLSHLFKNGLLGNKSVVSNGPLSCSVCKLAKSKTLPFPSGAYRASTCFEMIHSDVWGMSPIVSHARYKYFVTFIDDYSRFTWIYFLRAKSEVFSMFKKFLTYVETQFHANIQIFRSDSGGEYMSNEFQEFLQQKGILSQRSCPNTPQQNGMAERKNRHLLDVTRTLLLQASVPSQFWVEALSTAVFLINRLPSTVIDLDSPFFRLFKTQPDYNDLHTFGCVCFVHLPPFERHKLGAQSVQCAFLGYSHCHKGFVCYDVSNRRFRISRNVTFFEDQFMFHRVSPAMDDVVTLPNFSIMSQSIERYKPGYVYVRKSRQQVPTPLPDTDPPPDPVTVEPRRSGRISRPPDRYSPDRYDSSHTSLTASLSSVSVPTCYSQAVKDVRWIKAMNEELQALQENFTWDIVSCPPDVKPIGCK
jgi:transposase InsO family protein